MKNLCLILFVLSLTLSVYAQPPNFNENWTLVFSDEFSDPALNTDIWNYSVGAHCWGENEDQWYTDSIANIFIAEDSSDTSLFLKLIYDQIGMQCPQAQVSRIYDYTSGWINSCRRFQYGYFETRCKLPVSDSVWPAFWLWQSSGGTDAQKLDSLYNYWYDEIDMFEAYGHPTNYEVNYFDELWVPIKDAIPAHWAGESIVQKWDDRKPDSVDDVSEYHTYGVEWRENLLQFYCDGEPLKMFTDRVPNHPLILILNLAKIRGSDLTASENFIIDYVRVYKQQSVLDSLQLAITDTVILKNQYQIDLALEYDYILTGNGQDGAFVELEAESFIHFHAGFHAENGSTLSAKIVPLDTPCDSKTEFDFCDQSSKFKSKITKVDPKECLNEISDNESVRIYPNPSNGTFTVQYDAGVIKRIEVYDYSGRTVKATIESKSEHLCEVTLNYSGLFVLKLSDGDNIFIKKVYVK